MTTTDKSRADALTGPYSTRHRSIGDWLWCELMDYCKELGMPPADNDRLFAIVDQARAAWDRHVEQHEAAPASLEGLRRAVLTPRAFVRDEYGMLTHPAIPALDEDVNYQTFFAAFGIESTFVCMETDVDCDAYERYVESNDPNCSFWTPSTPAGDGWLLLEIYDTEDGPVALYVREKKPESMRERWKREKQEHLATQPAPSAPLEGTGNGADEAEHKLTCRAIDGAMAFGYQNTNPPPSADHWLAPYWHVGRKQAELETRATGRVAVADLPSFPTMLRKMWSGTEVQQWIDDCIKPLVQERHHDWHCAPRTEVAGAMLSGDASECLMAVVSHHRDFVNACKVMHFDAINDDSDAYWEKQIDVLNRMKAQAERALSEPFADAAAAPTDETCKCHRIGDWKGFHHPLRDKAHEDAPAAGAPPDERLAFESMQGAALFLTSNHAVTHVPIEGVQRNRTWVAQRLLDLVDAAKARAAASQPTAEPRAEVKDDDELCAERYRLLRRGQHWSVINGIGDTLSAGELDAVIDAVRAGGQ
ncbi:hypothetical protein [Burkholderia sp. Bp9004]|uniref:hypothetical protein n=1 Tax=Burkholderia sp. Bp9004 TaxID=2184559 RepID=UPI000F5F3DC1|nr:hypothetical protein [Burkholderia sp. Bp9004]